MSRLDTASLMLGDLDDIAAEWEALAEGERVAWSLDWSNEMSGLERVAYDLGAGLLSDIQGERFRDIQATLAEVRPTLERLDLYAPRFLSD